MPTTVGPSPLSQTQSDSKSTSSLTYSDPSSRSSDATQGTSQSTLFPPPLPPLVLPNGGPVEASDNVMNKIANKETSLFQICVNLRQRLRTVPGFEEILAEEEASADADTDPVTLLWRTFRRGDPLMIIYNALNPERHLEVDNSRVAESNRPKAATFKFLQACVNQLKFPAEECFIITDLYGDDTTGFVKVARVVNRVIDVLVEEGHIEDVQATDDSQALVTGETMRNKIISELVRTERTYVLHLELLQSFKKLVEEKGIIPGDAVHDIFLNLNALLDFQRRFLIRVEQTNAQPEAEQNWGKLFILYREAFKVYEPYIANQKRCDETVVREFDKLKDTGGSIEMRQMVEAPNTLYSFLMKPMQRISKYPMLLGELHDKGDLDEERKADLLEGKHAAISILESTNAAIHREECAEAVQELKNRVEDWKGHRVEGFGELLLHGNFTVLKGDVPNTKDQEREYKVYFFETILLCCKEINPNKPKNKILNKPPVERRGKPKLQLKGRIFMQNVTDTISTSRPGMYTCQIFWKGDPGIENFIIRFAREEDMKKWTAEVETRRRESRNAFRRSAGTQRTGPSSTEFTYMQSQGALENPYRQDDDADEDDDSDSTMPRYTLAFNYPISRNGSSTSLRSRSTTGDSGPPLHNGRVRATPPRFAAGIPQPSLTLRTLQLQATASLAEQGGQSYFSPSVDSPMSSRTSSSSGMFPFPRQQLPPNGYHGDEHVGRYTAPAIGRTATREPSGGHSNYLTNGRTVVQKSSLPSGSGLHSAQLFNLSQRNRSASSPDIQLPQRRTASGARPPVPDIPVPPFPYAYAPNTVNRSQTNSPSNPPYAPRSGTQSPNHVRDRSRVRPSKDSSSFDHDGPISQTRLDSRHAPTSRTATPAFDTRNMSPPPLSSTPVPGDMPAPTQLKVRVHAPSANQILSLVVPLNISFQTLKDRIDAKLQRSTSLSLSAGNVKLKYVDDNDFVSIQSDEDVQIAFETWREQVGLGQQPGQLGEIELYCQR